MHSMEEELTAANDIKTDAQDSKARAMLELVRKNGALSRLIDRYPGADTEAATIIADLLESGILKSES